MKGRFNTMILSLQTLSITTRDLGFSMTSPNRTPLDACRAVLIHGYHTSAPIVALGEKGYVSEASQNLIEGVRLDDFEADLRQGDGNELERKFRAAHSSSALAVNTFAPFKAKPAELPLPGVADSSTCISSRNFRTGLWVDAHQISTFQPKTRTAWPQLNSSVSKS
jgi:hypothetical protein